MKADAGKWNFYSYHKMTTYIFLYKQDLFYKFHTSYTNGYGTNVAVLDLLVTFM